MWFVTLEKKPVDIIYQYVISNGINSEKKTLQEIGDVENEGDSEWGDKRVQAHKISM